MKKRGLSEVIATILIIMIVVIAVGMVWAFVVPLIKDSLGSDVCQKADLSIVSYGGYTCYDATAGKVSVKIKKGVEDNNITNANLIFYGGGNSFNLTQTINLEKNTEQVFVVTNTLGKPIDKIGVSAIIKIGSTKKECNAVTTTEIDNCTLGDVPLTLPPSVSDTVYPQFSNYQDNNASLINSGTGLFNVTILNSNGTAILNINGTNVTATNTTYGGNIYNAAYSFVSNGTYSYRWYAFGNGTSKNINNSGARSYTVNASVVNTSGDLSVNGALTPDVTGVYTYSGFGDPLGYGYDYDYWSGPVVGGYTWYITDSYLQSEYYYIVNIFGEPYWWKNTEDINGNYNPNAYVDGTATVA